MLMDRHIGGLLLMGGVGKRFGSDTPKQFHRLAGKPVFLHTLEAFLSSGLFDEIVLSCCANWIDYVRTLLPTSTCPIRLIEGGATRQQSSLQGLLGFSAPPDIVVVHDAVRPFVTREILLNNVLGAIETGAVDTCIPSADTLVYSPDKTTIETIPNRAEFQRGQTPQSFSYPLLLRAHRETKRVDATDDCRLVLDLGEKIEIVKGDESNIKITSEMDLLLAEHLFRIKLQTLRARTPCSMQGKRYAIVGGTGGIGSALCQRLEELGAIALPLSRKTMPALDLYKPSTIRTAFKKIGPLDGLINCAGLLRVRTLQMLRLSDIEETLAVNLTGLIFCCKMAQIKEGGHVINIASSSFSRGRKETTIYSSAKAAVVNFTQGWAEERPDLRIHAIIPQRANTPMRRANFPEEDPKSLLDPRQIAEAVLALLQEEELTGLLVEVKHVDTRPLSQGTL